MIAHLPGAQRHMHFADRLDLGSTSVDLHERADKSIEIVPTPYFHDRFPR